MNQKFSQKIKDVLAYSREEAIRLGNSAINPDHLFLGILRDGEGEAINLLLSQGLDLSDIKKKMDKHCINLQISRSH
jgi:ATP-dependent Clp protease ATP-binding subunit ClpC